jgi:Abnormal spindle-like microcephaly-assoc'd, ASPM-SPD-2-Hydin
LPANFSFSRLTDAALAEHTPLPSGRASETGPGRARRCIRAFPLGNLHRVLLPIFFFSLFLVLSGCGGNVTVEQVPGTLSASPTAIAFGNVTVGQAAKSTITLHASASGPVQITELSASGQGFALSGQATLPITVQAGGTYDLDVQFNPVATGPVTGQITANGAALVALSGTGASVPVPPLLSALSCAGTAFTGSGTDSCTVTLTAPALSGGFAVSLSSSSSAVTVPALVTLATGATSANFTAIVSAVETAQAVTLQATAGTLSKTFALQLSAAVPTLSFSATSVVFGSVAVSTLATKTVILSSTGTAPVTVNSAAVTGTGFTISGATFPLALAPGQKATLTIGFDPTTASATTGQLTVTSDSSTDSSQVISLSGTGTAVLAALSCANASIVGSGTDACTVTLNTAAPAGGFSVSLSSNSTAVTLPASETVAAGSTSATFSAAVSAVTTAQVVTLDAKAGSVSKTFALQLDVTGPSLSINATSIAFGNVALNTPATQTVILSSTGTSSVTVNSAILVGVGFTLSGQAFPETLNPGQTATLGVEFDPTVLGAAAGVLTIVSTSSTNGTAVIAVTGTGTFPTSYVVDLSWDPPTDSTDPVAGYNIYRSPSGASNYQLLNPSVDGQTTYVDSTVQNGQTYDYIIESVDASGVESVPTGPVSAIIP